MDTDEKSLRLVHLQNIVHHLDNGVLLRKTVGRFTQDMGSIDAREMIGELCKICQCVRVCGITEKRRLVYVKRERYIERLCSNCGYKEREKLEKRNRRDKRDELRKDVVIPVAVSKDIDSTKHNTNNKKPKKKKKKKKSALAELLAKKRESSQC